jgi:3-phenylpropionate/cinnamic acid dioxygenase small subunit
MGDLATSVCLPSPVTLRHVPVNATTGYEIHEFLAQEALLLDHAHYEDWSTLLARDLKYRCPAHLFAAMSEPAGQALNYTAGEYDHDFLARYARHAGRLEQSSQVRSVRRLITNVVIELGCSSNMYSVRSYVLLMGTLDNTPGSPLVTIERHDTLRRCSVSYQIASRTIHLGPASMEVLRAARVL